MSQWSCLCSAIAWNVVKGRVPQTLMRPLNWGLIMVVAMGQHHGCQAECTGNAFEHHGQLLECPGPCVEAL